MKPEYFPKSGRWVFAWRMSFDPLTGDLYVGDVGQDAVEEIIFQPGTSMGGENYQWRVREGDASHASDSEYSEFGVRVGPIYDYNYSSGSFRGTLVTGGVLYRGCRMKALHGTYFFGDYGSCRIASFRVQGGQCVEFRDSRSRTRRGPMT